MINSEIIQAAINATVPDLRGYPEDGALVKIEFVQGFERFGAYETWGCGWRVSGRGVIRENKSLDEAVNAWALKVWEENLA